mgnify:CR=1 FL=1
MSKEALGMVETRGLVAAIEAETDAKNTVSQRVLEKCGFEYEITIEQGYKRFDGEFFDSC